MKRGFVGTIACRDRIGFKSLRALSSATAELHLGNNRYSNRGRSYKGRCFCRPAVRTRRCYVEGVQDKTSNDVLKSQSHGVFRFPSLSEGNHFLSASQTPHTLLPVSHRNPSHLAALLITGEHPLKASNSNHKNAHSMSLKFLPKIVRIPHRMERTSRLDPGDPQQIHLPTTNFSKLHAGSAI